MHSNRNARARAPPKRENAHVRISMYHEHAFFPGLNVCEMAILQRDVLIRPIEGVNNENTMSDNSVYYSSRIRVNCGHMAPTGIIEETDLLVPNSCDLHEKKAIGL